MNYLQAMLAVDAVCGIVIACLILTAPEGEQGEFGFREIRTG